VRLIDLPLKLVGVNLEDANLQAQITFFCAACRILLLLFALLLSLQIVVEVLNHFIQD